LRRDWQGPLWVLVGCLLFGAAMEAFKSETGFGFEFRSAVGNWSSLWLVMPLMMGYQFRRPQVGALAGLAATIAALLGFYAMNALIFPQPGGFTATVLTFSEIMSRWALFGVVSGPLFGALGTRVRSLGGLALLSGMVMILEPVVLALWGERQLPLPAPLGISWWFEWRVAATVEVVIGMLLLLFAVRRRAISRTG
jgi:hypothetical protein